MNIKMMKHINPFFREKKKYFMISESPSASVPSKKARVRELMEQSCLLNFCDRGKSFILVIYTLTKNDKFQGAQFFWSKMACV